MSKFKLISTILLLFLTSSICLSQEWKNLKAYQNASGKYYLDKGNWLKKDRLNNSLTWQQANRYNLSLSNGHLKYESISEIRDFYIWFDEERKRQGHHIIIFGVAAIVAQQLSNFDNYFVRNIIVNNKEIISFGNNGSRNVLAFFYPHMQSIYFSKDKLTGKAAVDWDKKLGKIEQCDIVESIYKSMSSKAIEKLSKMAKGEGIYRIKVKKQLRYEGDITSCQMRYTHAFTKLYTYYLNELL